MEERSYELLLWIEEKRGEESTDYDDEEQPHTHMHWTTRIYTKKVHAFNLREQLRRNSDGDYDYNVRVLYVTKLDGVVILDLVNHQYVHIHDYLDKEKEKSYTDRFKSIREDEERHIEEMITRIEKYPEQIVR